MLPPRYEIDDFVREKLLAKGPQHTGYYHYTRWDNLRNMMAEKPKARVLWMSRADKTNDGIESMWGKRVFMLCFSYTRYEDVAMWMNYGRRKPDAVRIRFDGRDVQDWWRNLEADPERYLYPINSSGCRLETDRLKFESVRLGDVAYVLPKRLLIGGLQEGNVDYGRTYYRVEKDGGVEWADSVFDNQPNELISPLFKKRGWGYEREVRLIVTLSEERPEIERLAVDFSIPFAGLEARMRQKGDDNNLFPELMSGPWLDDQKDDCVPICGISIRDIVASDYRREIRIFG